MNLKISKEKQTSLFFSMSFGIFVSFQKKIESLCLSNFIHMFTCVISFEYVEIISKDLTFFFFEIKLISKKIFTVNYLIQRFNPHLFS
jgi:hypothetical protein